MAAYIVIDRLSVTNPDTFRAYSGPARASVTSHGGRYIVRAEGQIEALEGNWTPSRIVVIAFDDAEGARRWWASPEYARPRAIHEDATISNIILVDDSA
jgi:uncharacterized protein (DUF1330 family)